MDIVKVKMTTPPPGTVNIGETYRIEGVATINGEIGAPPWVYARVQKKDWYKPAIVESTWYLRGFPKPAGGGFSMDWIPEEAGKYEVTLVATPALIPIPAIGVPPITGESKKVSVTAEEELSELSNLEITSYGISPVAPPTVIQVVPGDQINAVAEFDYIGPAVSGAKIRVVMYSWTLVDPHNEKAFRELSFDIPDSPDPGNHIKVPAVTLALPSSGLPEGLSYGLYAKVFNVVGKEWYTYIGEKDPPYYQWVIEVTGITSRVSNLVIGSYARA